jgi:septal ring factor EnvC (AmiA/AmiB activator)
MSATTFNPRRAVLLAAIVIGLAARSGTPAAHAANTLTTSKTPATAAPTTAVLKDPRIADLDSQIKALRDQYHAQLDPLESQVKALRDKFDPQIATLESQRHELIEASKAPQVRALDDQEAAELKQLSDQEKAEIEKVRQRFSDQRKQVQAEYKEKRELVAKK